MQVHSASVFFQTQTPALSKLLKLSKPHTHDKRPSCVSNQPTPALLNATGHSLLRSIATGQSASLRSAADSLERLAALLPTASAEARLTAVLMSLAADPTPQAETTVQSPTPAPARRQAKAGKPAKASRRSKASNPRFDSSGRLQPSKEIGGVAVVSQAEARKVLGVSCVQMLRLEGQKVLTRVQENGSRLVYYAITEVQRLIDMIDATPPPPL